MSANENSIVTPSRPSEGGDAEREREEIQRFFEERDRLLSEGNVDEVHARAEEFLERAITMDAPELVARMMAVIFDCDYAMGRFDRILEQALEANEIYARSSHREGSALFLNNIAAAHILRHEYEAALSHLEKAKEVAVAEGDVFNEAVAENKCGIVYRYMDRVDESMTSRRRSVDLFESIGHTRRAVQALGSLGAFFDGMGNSELALEVHEEAFQKAKSLNSPNLLAICSFRRGVSNSIAENYDQAITDLLSAEKEIADRAQSHLPLLYNALAHAYQEKGMSALSIEYAQRSFNLAKEQKDYHQMLGTLCRIGEAMLPENFQEGLDTLIYACGLNEFAPTLEIDHSFFCVHQKVAEAYESRGEIEKALDYYKRSWEIKERCDARFYNDNLNALRTQYEVERAKSDQALEKARREQTEVQLILKQQELAAQAMTLARQTELLSRFRNDLRAIVRQADRAEEAIRAVKEKLKELPCEAIDWTKFEAEFQMTYPEFRAKLVARFPELTKMEVKVASLLKLRLTSADISQLLCLSDRSVEGHRLRLRRKLGLTRGQDLATALSEI